jgi:diaminopimelate epimerase
VSLEFSKYHGHGNDFLLVYGEEVSPDEARSILDRNFGVGADGLILIKPSDVADFSFRLLQPDGSQAELSGNGMRCVGKFLFEKGLFSDTTIKVEAAGETKVLELILDGKIVTGVRVDMGIPIEEGTVELQGRIWKKVSTGNPHAVTTVDEIDKAPVVELGPLVENDPHFPNRTNVEFIKVEGDVVHARFWERGVGVTLSSGTGSCASLVASGLTKGKVRSLGGELQIEHDNNGRLFMTGPATHVFDGRIP